MLTSAHQDHQVFLLPFAGAWRSRVGALDLRSSSWSYLKHPLRKVLTICRTMTIDAAFTIDIFSLPDCA